MQHDLVRSGRDLDLRSNCQNDLIRFNSSSLVASRQEKQDFEEKPLSLVQI